MSTDKQATVLLVEDDAPQRKTLRGFLLKRGYQVLEADSGEAAIAIARENQVDLRPCLGNHGDYLLELHPWECVI